MKSLQNRILLSEDGGNGTKSQSQSILSSKLSIIICSKLSLHNSFSLQFYGVRDFLYDLGLDFLSLGDLDFIEALTLRPIFHFLFKSTFKIFSEVLKKVIKNA